MKTSKHTWTWQDIAVYCIIFGLVPLLSILSIAYIHASQDTVNNTEGLQIEDAYISEIVDWASTTYTEDAELGVATEHVSAIEEEEPEEDVFTPYIKLTEEDIEELATLVYLEGGIESYECQKAIASVVINRMTTSGKTLQEVIYEPDQFTPAYLISCSEPSESTMEAVKEVISYGPTIPEYVTYFRANYYFDWGDRYVSYTCIDDTYFTYDTWLKDEVEK